jgi:hypothetical protein
MGENFSFVEKFSYLDAFQRGASAELFQKNLTMNGGKSAVKRFDSYCWIDS